MDEETDLFLAGPGFSLDDDRELAASRQADPSTALWRFLLDRVAGLGPLSAREVVHRACTSYSGGASGQPAIAVVLGLEAQAAAGLTWQAVVDALSGLFRPIQTREWSPCLVIQEGSITHFAPYLLTQFPEAQIERVGSISEAVERAHAERLNLRPAEALRAPLRAALQTSLDRVRRKEESLREALARGEKAESLKSRGQAILASVAQITPGQTELRWEGATIPLDPKLSPSENAQRYFKEYAKARDATKEVPALLDGARLEREYLEQMLVHVELAEEETELRTLSREIAEAADGHAGAGVRPAPPSARTAARQKPGKPRPNLNAGTVKRLTSSEGHQMLVGGSARGNERATFELGVGADLWLHARGVPGAHVIVKLGGLEPSRPTILEAARLAATNSQARGSTKVPVDYTLQRYVKKVKGGPPGLVTYSQEKTVRVDAEDTAPST